MPLPVVPGVENDCGLLLVLVPCALTCASSCTSSSPMPSPRQGLTQGFPGSFSQEVDEAYISEKELEGKLDRLRDELEFLKNFYDQVSEAGSVSLRFLGDAIAGAMSLP